MATRSRRRHDSGGPSEVQWAWLTAAPDCNRFLGFSRHRDHLLTLWSEHEDGIRAEWRDNPPDELPPRHPMEARMPQELRGPAELDPRRILGGTDEDEVEKYRQRMHAWRAARREWFATAMR